MTTDGRVLRGGATRELVLDAALALFAEQGYRVTSVREIAARCGMTHPGLLYHFPSKAELLLQALQRRDELDSSEGENGEVAFAKLPPRMVLQHLVDSAEHNATKRGVVELFANLSVEATAADHPAHQYFVDRYASLRATLTTALEELATARALRPGVLPATAAAHLIALMDGLQIQWLLDSDTDMPRELRSYINSLLTEPLGDSDSPT